MQRQIIQTPLAPKAIGTYSQAVRAGDTVYISGQIPLDPASGQLVTGDIEAEIRRVFDNISRDRQGRRRLARQCGEADRIPDRPGAFPEGQRDHGDLFQRALSGARRGRRRLAAARCAG